MNKFNTKDLEDIIAALTIAAESKLVNDYTKDRYNSITDKIVKYLEKLHDV